MAKAVTQMVKVMAEKVVTEMVAVMVAAEAAAEAAAEVTEVEMVEWQGMDEATTMALIPMRVAASH
jgi:hypothetical protein